MRQFHYRHYVLVVLTAMLTFNYVDRAALGIVQEGLKAELHLTDTQLGLLGGIAFALFYAVMGVPIARWADRGNRILILSVTTVMWSIAVVVCGLAGSFAQLLAIRVVVAVGEAGCAAPSLSLIATYFSRAERTWANAMWGLGGGLACVIGYFAAGWLNEVYGWRVTFMVIGLPGTALATLAWLTLREPRKMQPSSAAGVRWRARSEPTLREVCVTLWANKTFRHLTLCLAVNFFFGYGTWQWQPTFFIRSHGFNTAQLGAWLAAVTGVTSIIGTYLCGELSLRAAHNERLQLQAMAWAVAASSVMLALIYVAPNPYAAFAMYGLVNLTQSSLNGPMFSTIQMVVPERMCAVAFALVYLVGNLVGMGLGPLAVGALSDALRPLVGEESLRYALLVLAPGYFWVAWHAWRASQTVDHDLAKLPVHLRVPEPDSERVEAAAESAPIRANARR